MAQDQTETSLDQPSGVYRYVVLALLMGVYVLSYLDRQLVSILAQPIKAELHLSDTQLGLVSGVFFALFYTGFGIPIAWLADRSHRTRIVALACGLWSLFTGACGLAGNFGQLALARLGVGIGEAGGTAPSYALVADYFPPKARGAALGLFSLGLPIGTALGGMYGGWIAPLYGWRMAFWGLAIPGILLGVALRFLVKEPPRGQLDLATSSDPKPGILTVLSAFVRSPVLVWTTLGCSLSGMAGYGILTWAPALLMRSYGMTLPMVGAIYSPVMGLAIGAGVFLSGWIADSWGKSDPRAYALVPALSFVVGGPLLYLALHASNWHSAIPLLAAPLLLGFTYLSPALAVVQNSVPAERRSTSSAILLFVLNLSAIGLGPVLVGLVSDWAAPLHGEDALKVALQILVPTFFLGAGANFMAARAMRSASQNT